MSKILTPQQQQLVAQLKDDPGYLTLLDSIQAQIDDVADELENASSAELEQRKLNLWRAMRKILSTLRFVPEQIAQDLDRERGLMTENQAGLLEIQRPPNFARQAKYAYPLPPPWPGFPHTTTGGDEGATDPLIDWTPTT